MKILFVISFFISITGKTSNASGGEWSYGEHNGPSDWAANVNSICGKSFQSPIDIAANQVIPDHGLKPLQFSGYQQSLNGAKFTNNGHSVTLSLAGINPPFKVTDELNQTYTALQLHFHWTATDRSAGGSEHTIDGKHYPIEMHIVHIKDPYTASQLGDIHEMRDALLVIGVMLKVDDSVTTSPFSDILDPAPPFKDGEVIISTNVNLDSLLPSTRSFYRYYGSLTTPPCYEAVKWTVMQQSVSIPTAVLHRLKNGVYKTTKGISTDDLMGGNFRPVQPLNGRKITEFLEFDVDDGGHDDHSWTYTGPQRTSKWTKLSEGGDVGKNKDFQKCGLDHQSPININREETQQDSSKVGIIKFSPNYQQSTSGKLEANGHTIKYGLNQDSLTWSENSRTYRALQLHFHWAPVHFSDYNKEMEAIGGSEHTVDNNHYPLEMHIVHEKLSGGNTDGSDDLAVLATFFQYTSDESKINKVADEALGKLTANFMAVRYKGSQVDVYNGPILKELLPSEMWYYRYMGSLTTPPCTEAVYWTVFGTILTVSEQRFFEFQRILKIAQPSSASNNTSKAVKTYNAYVAGNFRPTQNLNHRNVYIYEEASAPVQIFFYVITVVIAVGILILGVYIYKRAMSRNSSGGSTKYTRGNTDTDILGGNTEVTNLE